MTDLKSQAEAIERLAKFYAQRSGYTGKDAWKTFRGWATGQYLSMLAANVAAMQTGLLASPHLDVGLFKNKDKVVGDIVYSALALTHAQIAALEVEG